MNGYSQLESDDVNNGNVVEISQKPRLGNQTTVMLPMNDSSPEPETIAVESEPKIELKPDEESAPEPKKEPEQEPQPRVLPFFLNLPGFQIIQTQHLSEFPSIMEGAEKDYRCFIPNAIQRDHRRPQEERLPLRRVTTSPGARPIKFSAEAASPTREARSTSKTRRLRKKKIEKEKANVIKVEDMPGYMGNLDVNEIIGRIEGVSASQTLKKPKKKPNKDIKAIGENLNKNRQSRGSVDIEENDVEITLDSEGIEVGDSSEQMEGFDHDRAKTKHPKKRRISRKSLDIVSTSSEEYSLVEKNYPSKTQPTGSFDDGSDTSGVEKSHSESALSPPIRNAHFDEIYDTKLRSQAQLLQNCWLRFMNDFRK